jgi:ornithine cyclodeaminase
MISIYARAQLEQVIEPNELIAAVRQGFIAYSQNRVVVPPVGELLFEDPVGDCHIKYGYIKGDDTFTVKVATGFSGNVDLGIPASNGIVLLFSCRTGALVAILQDEGFLTDSRTAAAGAVAASLLAPENVECIGIIGTGIQAHMQLDYLRYVLPTREAMVYSRSLDRARAFQVEGFESTPTSSIDQLCERCRLIVTTTPSHAWILGSKNIRPGTHITAVGADGGGKQELEPILFARSSICAVDSRAQCSQFGDSSYAIREGLIEESALVELGTLADAVARVRRNDVDITIADLTGVAVQDVQAAKLAMEKIANAKIGLFK